MGEAIMAAHRWNQEIIALQKELIEAVGLPPLEFSPVPADPLRQTIYAQYAEPLRQAKQIVPKAERNQATRTLLESIIKELMPGDGAAAATPAPIEPGEAEGPGEPERAETAPSPVPADTPVTVARIKAAFTAVEERVVRELILDGKRLD